MRTRSLTSILTVLALTLVVTPAWGTPVTVNVRVEGKSETLFEGPVETEGHAIQASSEGVAHPCDGTNAHHNPTPGATPTTAAVDAMSIVGQTFDGVWEDGFQDFKITRWGTDSANGEELEFWGLLVDQTFTSVGGCQVELAAGDQVLWVYNGFAKQPSLTLFAGSEPTGAAVATATVEVGKPLAVSVGGYTSSEGSHHAVKPFTAGAEVSPVDTGEHDFQKVETTSGESVTTEANGNASITFHTSGWHRLKATASGAFRSNRLDVCVVPCGPPPPDDLTRSPGTHKPPGEEPPPAPPGEEPPAQQTPPQPAQSAGAASVGVSAFTATRATQLRLGGLLLTPLDDRAAALSYHHHWRRLEEAGAWEGTVSIGTAGASVSVHLARGRPVFIVRDVRHRARVLVSFGTHNEVLAIAASASGVSRPLLLPRRASAGTVALRILSGTVGIDGVAVTA